MKRWIQFSSAAPELANGFTNPAPMVIEALSAMGRGDAVVKWLAGYRPQLITRSATQQRITDSNWRTETAGSFFRLASVLRQPVAGVVLG